MATTTEERGKIASKFIELPAITETFAFAYYLCFNIVPTDCFHIKMCRYIVYVPLCTDLGLKCQILCETFVVEPVHGEKNRDIFKIWIVPTTHHRHHYHKNTTIRTRREERQHRE